MSSILEANSYVQDSRREHTPPRKLSKKMSRASLPEAIPEQKVMHMVPHY